MQAGVVELISLHDLGMMLVSSAADLSVSSLLSLFAWPPAPPRLARTVYRSERNERTSREMEKVLQLFLPGSRKHGPLHSITLSREGAWIRAQSGTTILSFPIP